MKQLMTKWNEGDQVMFIDDQIRPSDANMNRMPRMGEVCVVRDVMGSTSDDTGERGVGLYLEGYVNPIDGGKIEHCYEAERFVPLAWIRDLLERETSVGPNGLPPSCGLVTRYLRLFGAYFNHRHCLYHIDHASGILDAVVPAPRGAFPFILRFVNKTDFVAEGLIPIRVAPECRPAVAALLESLNPSQKHGRYRLCERRHLVGYQLGVSPGEESVNDGGFADFVVNYATFLAGRAFDPLTEILYRGASPCETLERYNLAEAINTAPGAPGVFAGSDKLNRN